MGKKHKHPEHENLERWLVSYADFITLLFAVFVVLYAMGQIDLAKLKKVQISISSAFSSSFGIHDKTNGIMNGKKDNSLLDKTGNSLLDKIRPDPMTAKELDAAQNPPQQVGSITKVQNIVEKINQQIDQLNNSVLGNSPQVIGKKNGKNGLKDSVGIPIPRSIPKGLGKIPKVQIFLEERGIVIRFASSLFFDSGSSTIKPMGLAALDTLVGLLLSSNRIIHIEGHTDSQPIRSGAFPSNWDLSSSRASAVIRYFQSKYNFPSDHLAAVGYGDSRPLGDNNTYSGRMKNRRVDIVILYTAYSDITDAPKQYEQAPSAAPAEAESPKPVSEERPPAKSETQTAAFKQQTEIQASHKEQSEKSIVPDLSKDPIAVPTKTTSRH